MKKLLTMTVLLAIVLLSFAGCGKNMVDPKEYLTVDFSGLEGKGTAHAKFDYDNLEEVVLKASGLDMTDYTTLGELLVIMDAFSYDLKPTDGLSNGDEVVLTVSVNEKALEKTKVSYKPGEYKIKVEGLSEPTVIDAFADIEITYEGISPFLTAKIANRSTDKLIQESIRYSTEYAQNLANGDTITVTAEYNEQNLETKGFLVEEKQKDFVVTGGAEYLTAFSQIDKDVLTKMLSENEDLMESTLVTQRNNILYEAFRLHPEEYSNIFLREEIKEDVRLTHGVKDGYFFHLKVGENTGWGQSYNILLIENELLVHLPEITEPDSFIYPVYYTDLALSAEGELVVDHSKIVIQTLYKSAEDFKAKEITARRASYEIEEVSFK